MAEALACDFDVWLKDTLVALNTDDEVFSPYIKGILEGDDKQEEKYEALQGIISGITDNDIDSLCDEIFKKWSIFEDKPTVEAPSGQVLLDEKIAKIMEQQAQSVVVNKATSNENKEEKESLKNAILAQYSTVFEGADDPEEEEEDKDRRSMEALGLKNTNVEDVMRAEREKRDKNKEDSQRKKDKDKEDRSKQKSKEEERKEKEKKRTAKGERRR